ncbi:MAG: efflux RND transporter periplasmic adaptor subunit [Winogradskyella sp.]|uniref:efflux RND transporter periplasmic adaptor subunit n=1 Tax=Winogradskyella sp. TaxID=1883156 RepID=UPI00183C86EB|nr:efflux RND transporter periplasmic adaptor subunit [Winogradskyella sp.]MBT8245666.1 efflux RND transporter periplasmic adaptor subunit [Winogradskyella sp.]NNK22490.1 efflux RND transporter periplasmic adaptor subunit [Winogradskyella sp.]
MKHIFPILIVSILFISCGGDKAQTVEDILASRDVKVMQAKKDELVAKQQELAGKIKQLSDSLAELNPDKNIPLITTITAEPLKFKHFLELQGSVKTKQNLVLTPEMSGVLKQVFVKEGDNVFKGQLLARIDDGGMSQQKAQLQIQADLAKTTFERQKRLWEQKIGSEIQYLNAKSTYEATQEAVNQINQQLAKTVVRAPFSGVIDDVITEQGSVTAAGQSQLMRIVNLKDMYIETDVPESYITSIKNGKVVEVEFPILGKKIDATIRQTGNFINPANRTFKIEIAVPNKDKSIKPNLTARLKVNDYTNDNAILIPQSIISENANGEQYIYILSEIDGDRAIAKQAIISTGKTQGDEIEILSGLNKGDQIIKEGARSVKDRQTVRVVNAK